MAAADLKEIKYRVDVKDLILTPQDVSMLGTDYVKCPVFTFSENELEAYDLKTLNKIVSLLGIPSEAKNSRASLIDEISEFDEATPSQFPIDSAGLILKKNHRQKILSLTLYDRGLEIAYQNWNNGVLIANNTLTEYLGIVREYTCRSPNGNYLCHEEFHFRMTDKYLSWVINHPDDGYYITYNSGANKVSKQQYETELAQELSKLEAIPRAARREITEAPIPLENIIGDYLGTKINR
jgi:hypothetical protein